MHDCPEIPGPPPEIPRGRIWAAMLLPPFTVVDATGMVAVAEGGLAGLTAVPMIAACAIILCHALFWRTLGKRYRGPSLVLMEAGYLFGQVLLCAATGWVSWRLFFGDP